MVAGMDVGRRVVRRVLSRLAGRAVASWDRPHPFDRAEGIETLGFIQPRPGDLHGVAGTAHVGYGGSQPSIVRRTLASLPDLAGYAFMDLGCGKGRALAVASEFAFTRIVGVELDPALAARARRNAAIVQARHPSRTPIEIREGDATTAEAAGERVVFFLYHPFHEALMARFVAHLERSLADGLRHCAVIYYNPVWHAPLDASPLLCRLDAVEMPYDRSEIGFGPDSADLVVTWQSRVGAWPSRPGAERSIVCPDGPWQARLGG